MKDSKIYWDAGSDLTCNIYLRKTTISYTILDPCGLLLHDFNFIWISYTFIFNLIYIDLSFIYYLRLWPCKYWWVEYMGEAIICRISPGALYFWNILRVMVFGNCYLIWLVGSGYTLIRVVIEDRKLINFYCFTTTHYIM